MGKENRDLVSTKITRTTKLQLAFIKSQLVTEQTQVAKSDHAAISRLVEAEYNRLVDELGKQA